MVLEGHSAAEAFTFASGLPTVSVLPSCDILGWKALLDGTTYSRVINAHLKLQEVQPKFRFYCWLPAKALLFS